MGSTVQTWWDSLINMWPRPDTPGMAGSRQGPDTRTRNRRRPLSTLEKTVRIAEAEEELQKEYGVRSFYPVSGNQSDYWRPSTPHYNADPFPSHSVKEGESQRSLMMEGRPRSMEGRPPSMEGRPLSIDDHLPPSLSEILLRKFELEGY